MEAAPQRIPGDTKRVHMDGGEWARQEQVMGVQCGSCSTAWGSVGCLCMEVHLGVILEELLVWE